REAVRILAEWRSPHGQDRVLGNWRVAARDDLDRNDQSFGGSLILLLQQNELAADAAVACAQLDLAFAAGPLASLARDRTRSGSSRSAALNALSKLDANGAAAVTAAIDADDPTELRTAAVALYAEREPAKAAPVLSSLCQKAERQERQAAFAALGTLQHELGGTILLQWLTDLQQGKVDAEVQLDVLLAAAQRKEPAVVELLRTLEQGDAADDPLLAFRACLEGGDVEKGKRLFFEHEATRCTRCHTQNGKGGNAGPVLDGIGSRQTRQYLLAALVTPSAQIADGFATTVLQLHNGDLLSGIVTKDQDGMVEITGLDGETKKVEQNRIAERRTASDSAMPPMGGTLDRRQLRDVIAFLASLQTAAK
ncbi:MAG: c-type cytochrome, partial [Planctomycetota bacterium]